MYGKIVDGQLHPAPVEFIEDGKRIRGFTDGFLRERGYKPVVFSEDEPGETDTEVWTENEHNIVQSWEEPQE